MDHSGKQRMSYKEKKIGNTVYCITSVYTGEKDLKKTLEELAVRRAMADQSAQRK